MIDRLADLVLRLTVPDRDARSAIRSDLIRESDELARYRSASVVALWRLLESVKIGGRFLVERWLGHGAAVPHAAHERDPASKLRLRTSSGGHFNDLLSDLRYSIRRLTRAPLMTGAAVAVAGIGIGASTATFSVLDAVIIRPLPYRDAEQLVQISETNPDQVEGRRGRFSDGPVSPQNYLDYQNAPSFADMSWTAEYLDGQGVIGSSDGGSQKVGVIEVGPTFFSVLGVSPALGRAFLPDERISFGGINVGGTGVLIISHELWAGRFASDPDIVGKTISFEAASFTVVGVLPRDFRFPPLSARGTVRERDVDVYIPLSFPAFTFPRDAGRFMVIGRVREGTTIEDARGDIRRISARLTAEYPEIEAGWTALVTPLHDQLVRDYGLALYSVAGMVGLVLLVACVNLGTLGLAQGVRRGPELAVRAAIGGGQGRLLRLLLTESLLLAALGGVLGLVLADRATRALVALIPVDIPRAADAGIDGRVLTVAAAISALVGVIAGLLPALHSSRGDLVREMKVGGRNQRATAARLPPISLVTVQVALTLVLLMGAALFGKSYARLRGTDLGYDAERVLRVTIEEGRMDLFYELAWWDLENRRRRWAASTEVMDRVRALPGVRSVAAGDVNLDRTNPMRVQFRPYGNGFDLTPDETLFSFVEWVSPDYFRTLGIPVVRGRELPAWSGAEDAAQYWWQTDGLQCFQEAKAAGWGYSPEVGPPNRFERCDGPEVLVSASFAVMAWPGEDPIGKELGITGCCWTVGGVVADVNSRGIDAPLVGGSVDETPRAILYVPYMDLGPFLVKSDVDPLALVTPVRDIITSVNPSWSVSFETLERRVAESFARPRFYAAVATLFAAVALVMAMVGLYGVVAESVGRRVHEIGVRVALGAPMDRVRSMVVSQSMRPVLSGTALGVLGSVALLTLIDGLLYGMPALDLPLMLGVSAALVLASFVACYPPASRASRVDPCRALAED